MDPDEFENRIETLKKRLTSGQISKDKYWEEIHRLETENYDSHDQLKEQVFQDFYSRSLKIVLFLSPLFIAGFFIYLLFFYYPSPENIDIEVSGSGLLPATSKEKAGIFTGMTLIQEYSPEDYAFVERYVDKIEVSGPRGMGFFGRIRGYYQSGPEGFGKTIRIVRDFNCPAHCQDQGWNGNDLLTAEFIIHEACHSMQYHTGTKFSEPPCYEMQFEFADKVGPILWPDFKREVFIYNPSLA